MSASAASTTRLLHLPRFRTAGGAKVFFSNELKAELKGYDALEELRDGLPADFGRWHPLSQAQYLEAAHLARATSSLRKATTWRWPIRSRGAPSRPPAGGVRRHDPTPAENPRPARKAYPAPGHARSVPPEIGNHYQAALPRARQPVFHRPIGARLCRRDAVAASA